MNLKGVFAKNERGYRLNAIKKFSKRGEPPPPRPLQNIILPPPPSKSPSCASAYEDCSNIYACLFVCLNFRHEIPRSVRTNEISLLGFIKVLS